MEGFKKKYSNLNLLPHDSNILLKDNKEKIKFLKLMIDIVNSLKLSINAFFNGIVDAFDAHVGDTLCQIRAYKISLLFNNDNFSFELHSISSFLSSINEKCEIKLKEFEMFSSSSGGSNDRGEKYLTLAGFFDSFWGCFPVSENVIFIFLSYVLSKFAILDEHGISISVNYKLFADFFDLTSSYSKKIVCFYQKLLSELSCGFIENILLEVPGLEITAEAIKLLSLKSENNRMVLPCYFVSKIIFYHIMNNRTPIRVKFLRSYSTLNQTFILISNKDKSDFEFLPLDYSTRNKYVLEMWVTGSFKNIAYQVNNKAEFSFNRLILANQAAHPQYSGRKLQDLSADPFLNSLNLNPNNSRMFLKFSREIQFYKSIAEREGCCGKNPSLFYIKHILCGLPVVDLRLSDLARISYNSTGSENLTTLS